MPIKDLARRDRRVTLRAMKGVRGLLTIAACLLLATPAVAGTLYRCDGADGARSYVSKRVAGAKCVVVAGRKEKTTYGIEVWIENGKVVSLF